MRKSLLVLLCFALTQLLSAEGTKPWYQSKYEDFQKGTAKGVAISSNGSLELAPALKPVATTPSTYIWAITSDDSGNVYAAAGAPARVYKIAPQGQISIIFEPQELQVQALLADKDGTIYAATSPDGKVYKITHSGKEPRGHGKSEAAQAEAAQVLAKSTDSGQQKPGEPEQPQTVPVEPSYKSSVFFDPSTKYIWDLAEDREGRIYVATGDRGEIYRVEKNGTGAVYFKSDEAHIRVLALDAKGNLIAGSDGSGLVYRISPTGDAFVLYSAPKKEITALAIDPDGNIYAAGIGEKRQAGASVAPVMSMPLPVNPAPTAVTQTPTNPLAVPVPTIPSTLHIQPPTATGGSEIYRIAPDGSPKRIWSSKDDLVYVLGFDQRGRLLAGTGNQARIFLVGDDDFTDMGKASASQVTGIARAPKNGLYLSTSNLGKIFLLSGVADSDGTFESDVLDAHIFSRWGRTAVRGAGSFDLFVRSGNVDNPDRNWSQWKRVDFAKELPVEAPPARFVQWKAVLHPGNPPASLDSVLLYYLPQNVAPEVDDVFVQTGASFPSTPRMTAANNGPVTVGPPPAGSIPTPRFEASPTALRDRDSIAVRWTAHDDNDDDLVYSLYYKGDGETRWKLLKDDIEDKHYSFDASLLPDGGYTLLLVASDAPSHSPEEALSASKQSARFEVDTTPPQVLNLTGVEEGDTIHVTFRAADVFSPIKRAEYSIDAGDWHLVDPVGQISDYRVENYDFSVEIPTTNSTLAENGKLHATSDGKTGADRRDPPSAAAQEHVIVVRAYDRFENMASGKTVIRARQSKR